ncbi:MAG: branched-chain amino acid ABC transporter permease, partial [Actinomycetota bacterium]|nr:branched-chain amino acid ABC transporter permease [Actinomycetota bacterium]
PELTAAPSAGPDRIGIPDRTSSPPWRLRGDRVGRWPTAAVVAGLLVAVAGSLGPYPDFQLAAIASYAVAVAGLSLLVGQGGRASFGQGALMAVGAYSQATLTTLLGVPALAALVLAVAVGGVAGAALGLLTARLPGSSFAVVTLVLAVTVPSLPAGLPAAFGGSGGLPARPFLPSAPGVATQWWPAVVCCVVAVTVLTALANLVDSSFGRSLRAVRDDPEAAELGGLSVRLVRTTGFAASAACGALGGALLTTVVGVASPDGFPLSLSLTLLAAVVLGGAGSLSGAVAGAGFVVLLPQLAAALADPLHLSVAAGANLPPAAYGLALIAVVRYAPGGLSAVCARGLRRLGGGQAADVD